MSRNPAGVHSKLSGSIAIPSTTIESADYNAQIDDIVASLNDTLLLNGVKAMTSPLVLSGDASSDLHAMPRQQFYAEGARLGVANTFTQTQTLPSWLIDTNFKASIISSKPTLTLDSNDVIEFDRTNNVFNFVLGGVVVGTVDAAGFSTGSVPSAIPAGASMEYHGATLPTGWLWMDGSAVSRTTYADLFTAIGTTHGAGNGSTTFNVPDKRGRGGIGKDNMGGTAANRVTTAGSGIDGVTLGATGGAQNVTLTVTEMPAHAHPGSTATIPTNDGGGSGATVNNGGGTNTGNLTPSLSIASQGGGAAHNNMPPVLVCNFIIKY